jgi:hypothetical protein
MYLYLLENDYIKWLNPFCLRFPGHLWPLI